MLPKQTIGEDVASEAVAEAMRLWAQADETPIKTPPADLQDCIGALIENHDVAPIRDYFWQFETKSCKAPVAFVASLLLSRLQGVPFAILSHEPLTDTAARADYELLRDSSAGLPEEITMHGVPSIVKTVTAVVHSNNSKHFLSITSLGDVAIDDYTLNAIGKLTGLSNNALKHHSHINSAEFDPVRRLGLEPGNIGPFPHHIVDIDHFILRQIDKPGFIAVRFSPRDTVCFARRLCQPLIVAYLHRLGRSYQLC